MSAVISKESIQYNMSESGQPMFPAANSPQRQQGSASGNATGSGRNKVALPKGRALMDWIRLGNSGTDLTGIGGRLIRVTPDELKRHNSKDDCWIAIDGAVYNVTQYCEFHPGGVAEIMKGAGKDATRMFNEVHRWVNYGSMLRKCLVGKLVNDGMFKAPQYGSLLAPPRAMATKLSTVNTPQTDPSSQNTFTVPFSRAASKPRYDYFQNDRAIKVSIYTRTPGVCADNVVMERTDGNVRISVYLPKDKCYTLHFVPSHPLLLSHSITSAKNAGKVEIDIPKAEHSVKWNRLGNFLAGHDTLGDNSTTEYMNCTLSEVTELTHDTRLYTIALPEGCHMSVATGYHVKLKAEILGTEIERSYTPVCDLVKSDTTSDYLHLIVKIYPDGALTQHINSLTPGSEIPVSHPLGQFNMSQLEAYKSVLLLAAGTGFTPMTKVICDCLRINKAVHLVFLNKTQSDIIWRKELQDLVELNDDLFKVTHVLSQADSSWKGPAGRLSMDMLRKYLPTEAKSETFVAACGPIPFVRLLQEYLADMNCDEKQFHIFQE